MPQNDLPSDHRPSSPSADPPQGHHKPGDTAETAPRFAIPLPDGVVARVPAEVLLRYVDPDARAAHDGVVVDADDVIAHDMKVDAVTGAHDYHTDYEHGEFLYDDGTGTVQRIIAWHRHPYGTEYAEAYEG